VERQTHEGYIAYCFEGLASVCLGENDAPKAGALFGAANALRESLGTPASRTEQAEHDKGIDKVRSVLSSAPGEGAFSAVWEHGRALSLEQAIDYALNNSGKPGVLR